MFSPKATVHKPQLDLALIGILLIAAMWLLWLALPDQVSGNQNYDYFCCYSRAAYNALDGKGFILDNGVPAVMYPPGFSLLLIAVYKAGGWIGEPLAMKLYIVAFTLITVWALYWGVLRIMGRRHALLTALLWLTFPFFLWLSKQPNSETPFLACLAGAFCCYFLCWANRRPVLMAALAGLLAGCASLMRASGVLVGVILAAVLILFVRTFPLKRRILLGLVLVGMNVVAVLPWEIWAWRATGKWILLADFTNGYNDGVIFGILPPEGGGPTLELDPDVRALMERGRDREPHIGSAGAEFRFVKDEWSINRGAVLRFLWLKATRPWFGTHTRKFETGTMLITGTYVAIAIVGLWFLRKSQPALCALLIVVTLYFWGLAFIVMPLLRYMTPPLAFLMIAVAAAIRQTSLWKSIEERFITEA